MAKKYMTPEELQSYLSSNYTAKDLSVLAGISTQHAYNIVKGGIFPSRRVLDLVGINVLYGVSK